MRGGGQCCCLWQNREITMLSMYFRCSIHSYYKLCKYDITLTLFDKTYHFDEQSETTF
jgi:ABC-type uncharacterized transport system substrate-binding protein